MEFIKKYNSQNNDLGYNIYPGGPLGPRGILRMIETKKRIADKAHIREMTTKTFSEDRKKSKEARKITKEARKIAKEARKIAKEARKIAKEARIKEKSESIIRGEGYCFVKNLNDPEADANMIKTIENYMAEHKIRVIKKMIRLLKKYKKTREDNTK